MGFRETVEMQHFLPSIFMYKNKSSLFLY